MGSAEASRHVSPAGPAGWQASGGEQGRKGKGKTRKEEEKKEEEKKEEAADDNKKEEDKEKVNLFLVLRKSADALRREYGKQFIHSFEGIQGTSVSFSDAASIGDTIRTGFEAGNYDVCTMIYNKFVNAITQEITLTQLIPAEMNVDNNGDAGIHYEYEPEEDELLDSLLPRILSTQLYLSLIHI